MRKVEEFNKTQKIIDEFKKVSEKEAEIDSQIDKLNKRSNLAIERLKEEMKESPEDEKFNLDRKSVEDEYQRRISEVEKNTKDEIVELNKQKGEKKYFRTDNNLKTITMEIEEMKKEVKKEELELRKKNIELEDFYSEESHENNLKWQEIYKEKDKITNNITKLNAKIEEYSEFKKELESIILTPEEYKMVQEKNQIKHEKETVKVEETKKDSKEEEQLDEPKDKEVKTDEQNEDKKFENEEEEKEENKENIKADEQNIAEKQEDMQQRNDENVDNTIKKDNQEQQIDWKEIEKRDMKRLEEIRRAEKEKQKAEAEAKKEPNTDKTKSENDINENINITICNKGINIKVEDGKNTSKWNIPIKEIKNVGLDEEYVEDLMNDYKMDPNFTEVYDKNLIIAISELNRVMPEDKTRTIMSQYMQVLKDDCNLKDVEKFRKNVSITYDKTDMEYLKPKNFISKIINKNEFDYIKECADMAEWLEIADVKQDKPGAIRRFFSNIKNKVKLLGSGKEKIENTKEYISADDEGKALLKASEKYRNKENAITHHTTITEKNGKIKIAKETLKKNGKYKENPFKKTLYNKKASEESNQKHSETVVESDGDVLEKD